MENSGSRVQYGISVWGTATTTKLREIEIRLNNIVRTITWSKRFTYVTHLYKKLELLKLHDLCKLEIAKIMHKLFNNKLPPILKSRFAKTDMIHAHETRSVKQSNHFLPRVNKSICQNSIAFCGAKMRNEIDNDLKKSKFSCFQKTLQTKIVRTVLKPITVFLVQLNIACLLT